MTKLSHQLLLSQAKSGNHIKTQEMHLFDENVNKHFSALAFTI